MCITIEDCYERVLRLVALYPLPPSGFDPLTASNRHLAQFGLPERPDDDSEPEGLAFWQEMLGHPTEFVEPEFPEKTESELLRALRHRQGPGLRPRFDHRENSRNWSGAYITPLPRPNRFLQVAGAWTVPAPTVPGVLPSHANSSNEEYRSSTWIGIGGHRSYNSLPQIGTSQNVELVNGRPTVLTGAWWQWWVKGMREHHVPIPILNFDVREGDYILASVTVEAPWPGDARFNLKNRRSGRFVAFKVRAPAGILPLGATAEWIHERPTKFDSRDRYPMPDCREISFRRCLAWSAPDLGMPMLPQRLGNSARLIRMAEIFDRPHRSALVSLAERTGPTGVRLVYHEAGS
jgi:Peptidase A4 family